MSREWTAGYAAAPLGLPALRLEPTSAPGAAAPARVTRRIGQSELSSTISIQNVWVGRRIGEGSFGRVYLGECKHSGRPVAIKAELMPADRKSQLFIESKTYAHLQHSASTPCRSVLRVLGFFEAPPLDDEHEPARPARGEGRGRPRHPAPPHALRLMLMQMGGPCLADLVARYGTVRRKPLVKAAPNNNPLTWTRAVTPAVAAWIACRLVDALEELHAHNVLHRDMKPQNVVAAATTTAAGPCGPDFPLQLLDLGLAKCYRVTAEAGAAGGGGGSGGPADVAMAAAGACPTSTLASWDAHARGSGSPPSGAWSAAGGASHRHAPGTWTGGSEGSSDGHGTRSGHPRGGAPQHRHIPRRTGRPFIGTPLYASPWVHAGITASRRDDVWSAGIVAATCGGVVFPWMDGRRCAQRVPRGLPRVDRVRAMRAQQGRLKRHTEEWYPLLSKGFRRFYELLHATRFEEEPPYAALRAALALDMPRMHPQEYVPWLRGPVSARKDVGAADADAYGAMHTPP